MNTLCPFDKKPCTPECKLFSIPKDEGQSGECKILEILKGLGEIGEKFVKSSGGILGSLLGMGK